MKGKHYQAVGRWILSIFGLRCWKDDGEWYFEGDITGFDHFPIGKENQICFTPREIKMEIEKAIIKIAQSGKKITLISINNRTAALLWCEGALTLEDFQTAKEATDTVELSIQAMNLSGVRFVIRHYSQEPYGYVIHTEEE